MSDFWRFAKQMLRYPISLGLSVVMAILAATGLGVGLAAMVPTLQLMKDRTSLVQLAEQFNSKGSLVQIPQRIIDALPADPYAGVILIIGTLCVMSVIGCAVSFLHRYLSMTVAAKTVTRLRQEAFRHVLAMPLSRVIERGPSEYVSKIVRDTTELQSGFMAITNKSVAHITRGLACLAAALLASWEVTVIAPVGAVLIAVILRKFGKRIRRASRGSLQAQERLLRITTETLQGLRGVKVNTAERHAHWRFHKENKQLLKEEMRARTARALSSPVVEMLATLMVAGLAIIFAGRIIGGLPLEKFIVALASLGMAGGSLKPLTAIVNELQSAAAPARRLREVLNEPREEPRPSRRRSLPRHRHSIEFDAVTFRYPSAERPALTNVSLRIEHGERVALVGPNGSGKTTLISLLPRLLRPSQGRVLIDDIDVESVSLASLRRQIGLVTQETILFRGTIAENIAMGSLGVTREQVIEAARRAHAHGFITQLPGGYDADIAEQGASLSGGQRQRLAIARVILGDPSILILDEATSQIDAESDAAITAALADFCESRTAVVIAHRFATVQHADRIVVMDDGRIVDQGTHGELLSRCSLYERLTHTQLLGAGG